MGLFLNVIVPIVSVFAVGFILQKKKALDIRSVSSVSIYVLMPALVFSSLYEADFNTSYMKIFIFMFALFYAMVALNKIIAKIFKWDRKVESASILATGFMNSGNYGLPVVLFSLGEEALPMQYLSWSSSPYKTISLVSIMPPVVRVALVAQ